MAIVNTPKNELTDEQNESLRNFTASVAAEFKFRNNVSFATLNNQLKFTNRLYAGYTNQPRINNASSNRQTQSALSRMLINLNINNNKIAANTSVKLGFLAALYSENGTRYRNGTNSAFASIDANVSLTASQKTALKSAAATTFSAMFSSMFQAQVSATAKWSNSKSGLASSNASNILYSLQSSLTTSAFLGFTNTITESKAKKNEAMFHVAAGISAAFNGNVSSSTSNLMSSIMGSISLAGSFSGSTDSEVDGEYDKSMSRVTIAADASFALNGALKHLEETGALGEGQSSILRSSIVSSFFAGINLRAEYTCEGGDDDDA